MIFFGLYHWKDYLRFIWHRGPKKVFWCGSDILNAIDRYHRLWLVPKIKAKHYCENEVEQDFLKHHLDIDAEIRPMLFDEPIKYRICYTWVEKPNVYINCHPDREKEYGIDQIVELAYLFPNITFHVYGISQSEVWFDNSINEMRNLYYQLPNLIYHGHVEERLFNEHIKNFQGCIRLNEFDGFAETLAKSVLLGQYQFSKIEYPKMNYNSITGFLEQFKDRKEPNYEASNYWRKTLKENAHEVAHNWSW